VYELRFEVSIPYLFILRGGFLTTKLFIKINTPHVNGACPPTRVTLVDINNKYLLQLLAK